MPPKRKHLRVANSDTLPAEVQEMYRSVIPMVYYHDTQTDLIGHTYIIDREDLKAQLADPLAGYSIESLKNVRDLMGYMVQNLIDAIVTY